MSADRFGLDPVRSKVVYVRRLGCLQSRVLQSRLSGWAFKSIQIVRGFKRPSRPKWMLATWETPV
jgi:hypothetical protein